MMEAFSYPHLSTTCYIGLFTEVNNAALIKKRIISAATATGEEGDRERDALNFAFIDARTITSLLHLQTAAYSALVAQSHGKLLTRTVHSEILWMLNSSHNIAESIKRFGVNEKTASLVLVHIDPEERTYEEVRRKMEAVVDGNWTPLDRIQTITDWGLVKKYYRLNGEPALGGLGPETGVVNELVVSAVAMKSVQA